MKNPFDFYSITNDSFVPVVRITRGSARWDFPLDVLQDMSTKGEFGTEDAAQRSQSLAIFLFSKVTKLPEFEDLLEAENKYLVKCFFSSLSAWMKSKK